MDELKWKLFNHEQEGDHINFDYRNEKDINRLQYEYYRLQAKIQERREKEWKMKLALPCLAFFASFVLNPDKTIAVMKQVLEKEITAERYSLDNTLYVTVNALGDVDIYINS
jgi:hypothetical protein